MQTFHLTLDYVFSLARCWNQGYAMHSMITLYIHLAVSFICSYLSMLHWELASYCFLTCKYAVPQTSGRKRDYRHIPERSRYYHTDAPGN